MIRSTGIGSGLDVDNIITQLMNVERIPLQKLQSKESSIQTQVSTFGQLKSMLDSFGTQLTELKQLGKTNFFTTSISEPSRLDLTVSNTNSSIGNHTIVVSQLASAHKIASTGFAAANTSLGTTGSLNIQVGAQSFSITVDSTNNTLEGIKNAINNSNNNKGVQASILKVNNGSSDEYRLVLTSKQTGADYAISLSDTTGNTASTLNVSQTLNPAQNAQFTFDGYTVSRNSNTINDVVDGLTFTLKDNNPSPITIKINQDNDARNKDVLDKMKNFVTKFNDIINFIDNKSASAAEKDSTFNNIKREMRNVIEKAATGLNINLLAELGIKTAGSEKLSTSSGEAYVSTGKLKLDETKLKDLLNTKFDDVIKTLNDGTQGYLTRLSSTVDNLEKFNGLIDQKQKGLQSRLKNLDNQINKEQTRLDSTEQTYRQQYTKLDKVMSQFKSTSDYLTTQLSQLLPNNNSDK